MNRLRVRTPPVLLMLKDAKFSEVPDSTKFRKYTVFGELGRYVYLKIPPTTSPDDPEIKCNAVRYAHDLHLNRIHFEDEASVAIEVPD